ncbi:MAG: autotransporter translocation and assembly factor TamB, partial [Bradymonadia bacterium]
LEAWVNGELPETVEDVRAALGPLSVTAEVSARNFGAGGVAAERADVQLTIAGTAAAPELDAMLSVRGLAAFGVDVASAEATVSWADEVLNSELRASLPGIVDEVSFRATSRMGDDEISSRFSRVEVAKDGIRLATTAPVSVRVQHEAFWPSRVSIDGLRLNVFGGRVIASGDYRLLDGSFVTSIEVEDASLSEVAAFVAPDVDVAGRATLSLAARGSLAAPIIDLGVSVLDVRALGFDDVSGFGTFAYASSTLTADVTVSQSSDQLLLVEALTLPLMLDLSRGTYSLREREPWSGNVVLSDLDLSRMESFSPSIAELEMTGRLDAAVQLAGTPTAPRALINSGARSVSMTIPLEGQPDLSIRDAGAVLEGALESDDSGTVDVDLRLVVSSEGVDRGNATVRGDIDVQAIQTGTYDLSAQRFQASASLTRIELAALPEFLREQVPAEEGWIELSGIWNGTLSAPTAKASVSIGGVRVGDFGPFSGSAVVMAGESISLTSRVTRTGEQAPLVDASALLAQSLRDVLLDGISWRAPLSANAAIAPLPLPLFAPLDPAFEGSEGELEVRFSFEGSLLTPQFEGFAAVRDLRLVNGSLGSVRVDAGYSGFETEVSASISADDVIVCTASVAVSSPAEIESGELVLTPWEEWPVHGEIVANATPLALLLPTLVFGSLLESVDGVANINLTGRGTLGDPTLAGVVEIVDAEVSVIPLQRRLERIGIRANFTGSEAVLEEFRVGDSDGRATASGRVLFDGLAPREYELDVRFRDLFVADPAGSGVNLRGDVVVSGVFSDEDHQTNVLIDDMRVTLPDDTSAATGPTALPESILFVGEDVVRAHVGERDPPRIGATEASIDLPWVISVITTGSNELVQSFVTAGFEIDVVARIADGRLTATGEIPITRGQISVVGNAFDITRGVIRLLEGAREPDPLVDIEAVHVLPADVSEMLASAIGPPSGDSATIRLRVTGLLSELQADQENAVELYSDPPMDQSDIFMVLATGRLSEDGDSAEAEQGVEALSNLIAGFFSDRISQSLFIDTLSFETTSESQRVEGGKYIADSLYISGTYIRTPGEDDDNNFEVALQWILRRIGSGSLRVELRGGDRAKGGLELLYQLVPRSRASADREAESGIASD